MKWPVLFALKKRKKIVVTGYRCITHLYCLAVQVGFYSDAVECRTLSPADRVWSPVTALEFSHLLYLALAVNNPYLCMILFVLFGLYVAFKNLSVILRQCLDVAGSSMLTFRMLPHWNITPQTLWHDIPPSHIILTLSWPVLALLS